jgi:hypothetical protein
MTDESDEPGVYVFRRRAGRRCQQSCVPPTMAALLLSHPLGAYKCGKCKSQDSKRADRCNALRSTSLIVTTRTNNTNYS